jgi:hypothetical protein
MKTSGIKLPSGYRLLKFALRKFCYSLLSRHNMRDRNLVAIFVLKHIFRDRPSPKPQTGNAQQRRRHKALMRHTAASGFHRRWADVYSAGPWLGRVWTRTPHRLLRHTVASRFPSMRAALLGLDRFGSDNV